MLSCLWDGACKRTLAVNRKEQPMWQQQVSSLTIRVVFYHYIRRHITVKWNVLSASLNKTFPSFCSSNGLLDPWSSGGVMQSLTNTMVSIQIPYGAHHLDLRFANTGDTPAVRAARTQEKNIIRLWLTSNSGPHH